MLVHRHNHLVHGQFELFGRALHDANIGLMRNQPIKICRCLMRFGQNRIGSIFQHPHCQFKNSLPVHLQQRASHHLAARNLAGGTQNVSVLPVCMQITGQNARPVRRLEHHGTRTISKQHAGGAVLEIQNTGKHFCANHQSFAGRARTYQRVGYGEGVHKTAANRLNVKRWAAMNTQFVLQNARR